MRIYIQVHLEGIVFGNGGYIALTALYRQLEQMGHEVYFFDPFITGAIPQSLIDVRPAAQYLSCQHLRVVGRFFVQRDHLPKVIISNWMSSKLYRILLWNGWENSFVFWDMGQLLRQSFRREAEWVLSTLAAHGKPLLICNRYLEPVYQSYLNVKEISYLDDFVRTDLFYYDPDSKRPGTVGYQPELPEPPSSPLSKYVREHINEDNLIFCTGHHEDVAEKMRRCDLFFWYNGKNENAELFSGESFGFSMIEALICGCVVIARENYFTRQIFPKELLCSSPEEGMSRVEDLLGDSYCKEQLREQCLEIARNYQFEGFDQDRLKTMEQILLNQSPSTTNGNPFGRLVKLLQTC